MSNKKLGLILLAVAVIVFAGFIAWQLINSDEAAAPAGSSTTEQNTTQSANEAAADPGTTATYTASQVAAHNSADDCWTIIDGKVYDITSYIPRHPGGDEILRACGADGTSLFERRETATGESVGSGTPHSSSAAAQLASLQIGVLAD